MKKEVVRVSGVSMLSSGDYDRLSDQVFERTKERLSPTTLKRFWGYLRNEQVQTRQHTLDVLARFIGYRNYEAFCEHPESGHLFGEVIHANDLKRGQQLVLAWKPDRRMVVEYLGDAMFVIRHTEKTQLQVGCTFECHIMAQHEHLVLDHLTLNGVQLKPYIIGNIDGVNIEL